MSQIARARAASGGDGAVAGALEGAAVEEPPRVLGAESPCDELVRPVEPGVPVPTVRVTRDKVAQMGLEKPPRSLVGVRPVAQLGCGRPESVCCGRREPWRIDPRRAVVKRCSRSRGLSANWNSARELATGKYVALFHDDDYYHRRCVFEMVERLEAPNVSRWSTWRRLQ